MENLIELKNEELREVDGGFIMYYAAAATVLYFAGYGLHWAYDELTN